ncbi:MAG TPA: 50S ribosomal protein L6 [Oligoflexia bacterium]|nr:50S ribosomal protein L6 [Oligoflexia bacterium]
MSRIGKQPVVLPKGVKAIVAGQLLKVEGPKGKLERQVQPQIKVELVEGKLVFTRSSDETKIRALHGMERALANNMVKGVAEGFEKQLALVGVGYRVEEKGKNLLFNLGYSHPIEFDIPPGITASLVKEGREVFVKVEGIDRQLVGQIAAKIRELRAPEPYKGKGVRYRNEVVRTKAGKAGKK